MFTSNRITIQTSSLVYAIRWATRQAPTPEFGFQSPCPLPKAVATRGFAHLSRVPLSRWFSVRSSGGFILLLATPPLSLRLPDMRTENHAPNSSLTFGGPCSAVSLWACRHPPSHGSPLLTARHTSEPRDPRAPFRSPPRRESGDFRFGHASPSSEADLRNRRTHDAPDSSLSLRLKARRSASSPIRSGDDARGRCARSARLGLRKGATAPRQDFPAERRDIATPRPFTMAAADCDL